MNLDDENILFKNINPSAKTVGLCKNRQRQLILRTADNVIGCNDYQAKENSEKVVTIPVTDSLLRLICIGCVAFPNEPQG